MAQPDGASHMPVQVHWHPVGAVTTVIALPWQSAADVHCTQAPALRV